MATGTGLSDSGAPALEIKDYAVIGDCRTAVLISRNGSIDWGCFPAFDSSATFLRLLDLEKGGFFQIAPDGPFEACRCYEAATNVLTTVFETSGGAVRLTDFMPPWRRDQGPDAPSRILRQVEGLAGDVDLIVSFRATFDFAREPARMWSLDRRLTAAGPTHALVLDGVEGWSEPEAGTASARFRVSANQRQWIVLTTGAPGSLPELGNAECEAALVACRKHWHRWTTSITYDGPWRELVVRNALVLRMLIYEPTGALVAAPTTSLPTVIGGSLNWDYRFTWLRDSGLILDVLQALGHHEESQRFFDWIENLCLCGERMLQPIYRLDGERDLPEQLLSHLRGHRDSSPVRIGNAAAHQDQLDIYGHVLDATWLCFSRMPRRMNPVLWNILRHLTDLVACRWVEPDCGIWEVRDGKQHFLYSKLFSWVALDRALRLARKFGLVGDLSGWSRARDEVRSTILDYGYRRDVGAFTQALGSDALDATALAIPSVDFLPASDPRMRSTYERVTEQLSDNGLLRRYGKAGLPGAGIEGAFVMCSFWQVENLARQGRLEEATDLFEHITRCGNDLGLFSEQIDPGTGEALGNFPQGYTHLTLIRAALTIHHVEQELRR